MPEIFSIFSSSQSLKGITNEGGVTGKFRTLGSPEPHQGGRPYLR